MNFNTQKLNISTGSWWKISRKGCSQITIHIFLLHNQKLIYRTQLHFWQTPLFILHMMLILTLSPGNPSNPGIPVSPTSPLSPGAPLRPCSPGIPGIPNTPCSPSRPNYRHQNTIQPKHQNTMLILWTGNTPCSPSRPKHQNTMLGNCIFKKNK